MGREGTLWGQGRGILYLTRVHMLQGLVLEEMGQGEELSG